MAATHEERQGHTSGPWAVETPSKGSLEWDVVKLDGPDEPWRIALCYDGADGASSEANARLIAASPMLLDAVRKLVGAVEDLISESHGVYGLHLNGDPAPWSDLTAGGRFEDWLLPLEEARAAIAKAEGRS